MVGLHSIKVAPCQGNGQWKILYGRKRQGIYFESGKIDVLKKSQGVLK